MGPGRWGKGLASCRTQALAMGLLGLGSAPSPPWGGAWGGPGGLALPWKLLFHPSPDLRAENRSCPSLCFQKPLEFALPGTRGRVTGTL